MGRAYRCLGLRFWCRTWDGHADGDGLEHQSCLLRKGMHFAGVGLGRLSVVVVVDWDRDRGSRAGRGSDTCRLRGRARGRGSQRA